MRIGLLTSRSARKLVSDVASRLGPGVEVIEVPVPVISFLSTRTLAKILASRRDLMSKLDSVDMIIIPGRVSGSTEEIERVIGKPVYKGPRDVGLIPVVVKHLMDGMRLDRVKPAEEVLGSIDVDGDYETAFKLGGLDVPLHGPPILVVSEIHPGVPGDRIYLEARRHIRDGAQAILVGASHDMDPGDLARRVKTVLKAGPGAVVAEAPTRRHAEEALSAGAHGVSVSVDVLPSLLDLLEGEDAVILGDRDLGRLRLGLEMLESKGVDKVIVDPVLGLPLIDFVDSIERYRRAHELGKPLMLTAANVTEEMEGDTHGMHALLAVIAVELGASLYLVVEETYKSVHGTAEAVEALRVASQAWSRKSTPRGLYSRLYVVKQPIPPPPPARVEAERVDYLEPSMDKRGFVEVYVDHERGVIGAVYRRLPDLQVVAAFEGVHPNSIARAMARRVGLDPEHAAYLGAELAKAHIALKLGVTYTQDEEVLQPVWEKVRRVAGGSKQSC